MENPEKQPAGRRQLGLAAATFFAATVAWGATNEAERVVKQALVDCQNRHMRDWNGIRNYVKDQLSTFIYHKTKRSPMILMTIMPV